MKCPVCGQENTDSAPKCVRCSFGELHKEFSNNEEHIKWLQEKAVPYGVNYILSSMSPTIARRLRLVMGLEDGIEHSDEEVAKEANVCVNRIQQHKATFLRMFKRLPCTIKLEELLKG